MIKDKKKLARVIATWLVTGVMLSVFILDTVVLVLDNIYVSKAEIINEDFSGNTGDDKIHFLNTSNSDCILIESNGLFALVDSGEGNENPRKDTEYKGYRDEVINYIKKVASDEDGVVHLDFILATHMHYDHAGNFTEIINCDDIRIKKAYIKKYDSSSVLKMDEENWGNGEMYKNIITALNKKNIPVIQNIPSEQFTFGDFTVQFINATTPEEIDVKDENSNSIGVKISKGEKNAFLAADFTSGTGLEDYYAESIGDVDLLKIGHHGYFGSSSKDFLQVLKPEIAVCTNQIGKIYPNVKWNLTMVAKASVFSTAHRNGIIATFTDKNEIILTQNIM
ncbi:MAG: MBL fold metallo-hydrolase [Clostridia bacterium]|nr:MBL fold metallo-hydrolase [Clostridia bacterium]